MATAKNIGYKNKQKSNDNIVLNIDGHVQHQGKTMADYFNRFFSHKYCI
jgi:hypothetical protein